MSSTVCKGDVVLVSDRHLGSVIGVVRYIGIVSKLSKKDPYIGVEISIRQNKSYKVTNYAHNNGKSYFSISNPNNGLFIQECKMSRIKPEDLLHKISIKGISDLFSTHLPIPSPVIPSPKTNPKLNPKTKPKANPDPNPDIISTDLKSLGRRLSTSIDFAQDEIKTFLQYCQDEEYDNKARITDDIMDVDESLIIDHMADQHDWNTSKQIQFVKQLRDALDNPLYNDNKLLNNNNNNNDQAKPIPIIKPTPTPAPAPTPIQVAATKYQLPSVYNVTIPMDIMKQKDDRSIKDVLRCFKKNNNINRDAIREIEQFFKIQKITTFNQLKTDINSNVTQLSSSNSSLQPFIEYISKCLHELSPPLLIPPATAITKAEEEEKKEIFRAQCRDAICIRDRDLIRYFLICEKISSELPSEIVDISDRICIEESQKRKYSHKNFRRDFPKKNIFKKFNKKQANKIAEGLSKYHHRLLPEFTYLPIRQIADKVSGAQKYCILLSHIIDCILKQSNTCNNSNNKKKKKSFFPFTVGFTGTNTNTNTSDDNKSNDNDNCIDSSCVPFMIDMLILTPGTYNKMEDCKYDPSEAQKFGDIKSKLDAYNIKYFSTAGLTKSVNNFDEMIASRIAKRIVVFIKKILSNFNKKNQRICMVIDRRWRINCGNFESYRELRKNASNLNGDYYSKNHDTIYIYQTILKNQQSYHQFPSSYIHEGLLYLTKQCIIPCINPQSMRLHIGGDSPQASLFIISAHINKPKYPKWYKYNMRWYIFLQSAALRYFPSDMDTIWLKYFADTDKDKKLNTAEIRKMFKFDLRECDSSFKRWYCAVKRFD